MQTTGTKLVPVLSSDGHPLMPCHPARARKLIATGRAAPRRYKGFFIIQVADRTGIEAQTQETVLNIDPGSRTTGLAVTRENHGCRTILSAVEIQHRAQELKAKLQRRNSLRRNRRRQLRHRAPRHLNRRKHNGWIAPSVKSLWTDTMRVIQTIRKICPVSTIRIERNKFDPRLMTDPNVWGEECKEGPLFQWQLRAYVLDRDQDRCLYCGIRGTHLEIDHVRPRATGSDRVDNLAACCRTCNQAKGNRSIENFLSKNQQLLEMVLKRLGQKPPSGATHLNIILPRLIKSLEGTGIPVEPCDAATTSWNRKEMGIPKTHCYDAALLGHGVTNIINLPQQVMSIKPTNGKSKQKANVDRNGTPVGKRFRENQQLPKHLRKRNPAPGHIGRTKRFGPELIGTGDTVLMHHKTGNIVGRAVIQTRGTRIRLSRTTPLKTAKIGLVKLIERNPGHTIETRPPSQQEHGDKTQDRKTL